MERFLSVASFLALFPLAYGDVGFGARYAAPFIPSACFGNDTAQFPSSKLFGAAGDGLWDNGASCGRQYKVKCVDAAVPGTCLSGRTIRIKIVDRVKTLRSKPSFNGAALVLSDTAFRAIAKASAKSIRIEFVEE